MSGKEISRQLSANHAKLLPRMPERDWFRNSEWTPAIEAIFFEKLRRARDKAQYLKIQSGYLTETHPAVALSLLEKYFALQEHLFDAEAFLQQAQAYLALRKDNDAIHCFQRALQRERDSPNVISTAWREFALFVATKKKRELFQDALRALDEHKRHIIFPVEEFVWYGAHALIAAAEGQDELAQDYAGKALASADKTHSGFRYHAKAGLVEGQFERLKRELQKLARK